MTRSWHASALPTPSPFPSCLCLMVAPLSPSRSRGKVKKATENVSYCHCHRLCHLPLAEKCQSAKVCSKIHKISVRPSSLRTVCLCCCLSISVFVAFSLLKLPIKGAGPSAPCPSACRLCSSVVREGFCTWHCFQCL